MSKKYIITGTDTGVGKTVVSAMIMQALAARGEAVSYWKPVQSGLEGGVDTRMVQKLSGLDDTHFLPETYVFSEPLSPHRAAEIDGVEIDVDSLTPPKVDPPSPEATARQVMIIEGAGGLMVPLTRGKLLVNQFKRWDASVILVARTGLGTINHTLLSLEALWARDIPVHGIVFVGEPNEDNVNVIAEMSGELILGHLPMLTELNADSLAVAFADGFEGEDF